MSSTSHPDAAQFGYQMALERLALEEARRSIDNQVAALNELRSRSATLTASASVIVSFLGAQALTRSGWTLLSSAAVLAFLGTVGLTAHICWPRHEHWNFRTDASVLLDDFAEPHRADGLSAERHLAQSLQRATEANAAKLDELYKPFRFALVLVGVQALLWTLQLSSAT
jgi:hypothetical protein